MKTLTEMFKQLTYELTYEQQIQGDKHKVNSLNLRCPELDTIHWETSFVMIGCSHVYGIGNEDDTTIPHLLSKKLNAPVINLGVPAASRQHIFLLALNLLALVRPVKTIIINTYPERIMDMTWKSYWSQRPHMRTQKSKDKLMLHRLEEMVFTKTHFNKLNKVFYDTLNQLFEDRILQIDIEDLEKMGWHEDVTSDGKHYGPKWNNYAAQYIKDLL